MANFQEDDQEPDYYMFDYEPYRGGSNPKHPGSDSQTLSYLKQGFLTEDYQQQRKRDFYKRIKSWLKKIVVSCKSDGSVVITIAPGHKADPNPSGFMHDVVGEFLDKNESLNITDGRGQLIRTKKVPKQSQTPGYRGESTHRGTIAINPSFKDYEDLNEDKIVLILDDVWTSGSTLRVCKEVMLTTNPKEVKLLAIGKTVPQPMED